MDVTIGKEKTSLPCHFRILITGATGFVGGALYTALQHRGDDVLGMARRTDRHSFLRDAASLHSLHGGDILDAARLAELMQGVDVVIHSAAALSGSYATQFRANVMGTQNVLQVAARAGVRHVIHISTIAVFGYDWPELIDEKTPLSPSHEAYSLSKAKAERAVHAFPQQHDLPVTIVRLGGVYGPGSDLWTETFFRLAASRYAALPGAGRGTAPLVFIDDLVDLLLRAIDHSTQVAESAIGPLHAVMTPAPTWHEFPRRVPGTGDRPCSGPCAGIGGPACCCDLCSTSLPGLHRPTARHRPPISCWTS